MHVYDLIEAMLFIETKIKKDVHIFNIGPNDKGVVVKKIAKLMSNKFGINTKIIYQKKTKGWLGDIPSFNYDTNKLKRLGFKKKVQTSLQAISKCIKEI